MRIGNENPPPFVSVDWLRVHFRDENVRVVDVRWSLKAPGRAAYAAGHIPGAPFVDLDTELSASTGPGRHPLPTTEQLAGVFGAIGVGDDTHVVAYDDANGSIAARVYFDLRRHGHSRVSVLDGGYPAWVEAGSPVESDVPSFTPRSLTLREPAGGQSVDKAHVRALAGREGVLVIDGRAAERYRGEVEPIDARPGHIPGARNVPWSDNVARIDGHIATLRSADELRKLYDAVGADRANEIIVYCGSGVTSCLNLMALERAGYGDRARLAVYDGSWSDWARDQDLKAALGSEP